MEGLTGSPGRAWRLAVLALGELAVPFDTTADGPLAESMISAAHREGGRPAATWAAEYLARRVAVFAFPASREGWRRGLRSAAERLGMPSSPPPSARPADAVDAPFLKGPADRLALNGGDGFSLAQLVGQPGGVATIAGLATRESLQSDFDWRPVLERLIDQHPPEHLAPLFRALRFNRKQALDATLAAGRRRLAAGDRDGTYRLATLALEATDRLCWSRRYGDGSRLDATRLLIDALPAEGRRRLWHLLAADAGDSAALEDRPEVVGRDAGGGALSGIR